MTTTSIHTSWQWLKKRINKIIWNGKESVLQDSWDHQDSLVSSMHPCLSFLTCSIRFMSGDWGGQSWSILTFFAFRNFDVEAQIWQGEVPHPADLSHAPILNLSIIFSPWNMANATQCFSHLLFNAGFLALIGHWIHSCYVSPVGEKGLDCQTNKRSCQTVVL